MPRRGKGACRSPTPSRVPSRRRQTQSRRGRRPAGRGPSRAAQTESAREVYRFSQKSWHTCRGRECSTRIEIRSSRIWEFFASRRKSAVVCKNGKWKSFAFDSCREKEATRTLVVTFPRLSFRDALVRGHDGGDDATSRARGARGDVRGDRVGAIAARAPQRVGVDVVVLVSAGPARDSHDEAGAGARRTHALALARRE